jgi:hypothetical protein
MSLDAGGDLDQAFGTLLKAAFAFMDPAYQWPLLKGEG